MNAALLLLSLDVTLHFLFLRPNSRMSTPHGHSCASLKSSGATGVRGTKCAFPSVLKRSWPPLLPPRPFPFLMAYCHSSDISPRAARPSHPTHLFPHVSIHSHA
ncbi:hypothetical protein F5888DRAFT_700192 [Russula emetica]|nr:hypothetical protein F5888DRAFT_700192 [Russula emetica]